MAVVLKRKPIVPTISALPTEPRSPIDDPWRYAYHIIGEKKIGKTSLAIEGCKALVLQFDKPSLAYKVREVMIKNGKDFEARLKQLEKHADDGNFPWDRIVVDGCAEWYSMAELMTNEHFGIDDPGEEAYGKGWRFFKNLFTGWMNRLLRIQGRTEAGLIFISHSEWKEVELRGGRKAMKMVATLPPRCEEIINGKVDAWFVYDYEGDDRVMILQGNQQVGAGHRIDGHFLTRDGQRIKDIYLGTSAKESLRNFIQAFNNDVDVVSSTDAKQKQIVRRATVPARVKQAVKR